ncbi:hypothetical protein [Candidatus Nitrospira neomarina]|uniref:ATP-grasp domain-containing protein n=1 Tax=Candidatus Nitrospira neomarina TaxID=3020899 RepID=A0AA96GQJ5_9BACT|nr:hypothetical protein [Candidatus Nitrospira neomarina]WNM63513.1 hypothetical protein PQG83_07100 [Candidatus Nitrospira neomarina]
MTPIISTLGGSDVTHIFVHDPVALSKNIPLEMRPPNVRGYDQRALVMARPHDVVCLTGKVDLSYLGFLHELGVGPELGNIIELESGPVFGECLDNDLFCPSVDSLHRICERISPQNQVVLNPDAVSQKGYVMAQALETILGRTVKFMGGNPEVTEAANLKHVAYRKAQELGIPVARGEIIEPSDGQAKNVTMLRSAIRRYISETGRVIIRSAEGRSGSGIFLIEDNTESERQAMELISQRPLSPGYLVQVLYEVAFSPNILVNVQPDGGAVTVVGISDQRLNLHLGHIGNVFPSGAQMLNDMSRAAEALGRWLQEDGFTGLAGFDFVEHADIRNGRRRWFFAEINARSNGSVYPTFLMAHLNVRQRDSGFPVIGAFFSMLARIQTVSFSEFRHVFDAGLFNPRTGRGMIPYGFCQRQMCCNIVFLGPTRHEVRALHEECVAQLSGR